MWVPSSSSSSCSSSMGKQSQLLLKPTEVELGLQVGVEFDNYYDWVGGGGITKYLLINCIPINHSRIQILKDLDIMVKFRQETHKNGEVLAWKIQTFLL